MSWKLKVLVQFALSHVPGGEALNHRLQRATGAHSERRIKLRVDQAIDFLAGLEPPVSISGSRIVEIGTGWDGVHPIVLSVLGAESVITFDHVRHLRFDLARRVVAALRADEVLARLSILAPDASERLRILAEADTLEDLLQRAAITYVAPSDATRSGLPSASVDIVYTYDVLEHLPETVIVDLLLEAKRILKPGGAMASVIDPGDHYVTVDPTLSRVNFLRYPEWIWAPLVKNKISYHNRLREKHFLDLFAAHGASVRWKKSHVVPSDVAAATRMRVNRRFAGLTAQELAVSRVDVVIDFPRTGEQSLAGDLTRTAAGC
jgi:SAM-dependent methyltransferase